MTQRNEDARRSQGFTAARRDQGFTLIEIMSVVIIMALLVGIVGYNVVGQLDNARVNTARAQIDRFKGALEFYRMDNAIYPSSEQGLDALVREPTGSPEPRRYQRGGYLQADNVPVDPWGEPYQYRSPGDNNPDTFDVWSFGADRAPGGEGNDADIGNWDNGFNDS